MTMLLIAADRCTGCRMCELACPLVHEGAFNPDKSRIWIEFEGMPELFYPNACRSCGKPPSFTAPFVKCPGNSGKLLSGISP